MIRPLAVVACVALVGCSGSDTQPSSATVVPVATPVPSVASSSDVAAPAAASATPPEVWAVEIDVTVGTAGLEGVVAAELDASGDVDVDPFVEFASCSGLRTSIGTYAVSAVSRSGPIQAVSVLSSQRAVAPGVHDAEVRVEQRFGSPVSAVGTMTLDPGLRSGSFLAFDLDGAEVSGQFTCTGGGDTPPEALPLGADDGQLDSIEIVALLRRGEAERVVSVAVATDASSGASLRCPGVGAGGGDEGPEVVLVDGDERIGSITTFELAGESAMTMRLHVGGARFDFTDVDATIDPSGSSGVFNALGDDGVTIDGAFRCT